MKAPRPQKSGIVARPVAARLPGLLRVAAATLLVSAPAFGATITWTTGAGTAPWSTAGNWTGTNTPPISGDALIFASTTGVTTLNNDLTNASFDIAGFTFSASAATYTINGNAFTLTGDITNSSTRLQTLNNAITLTAPRTITTTTGGGNVKLGGSLNGSGGGLIVNGTGTVILGADGSTYSGATVVNQGTLQLGDGGTTGSIPTGGTLALASGTTLAISRSSNVAQSTFTGAGAAFQSGLGGDVGFTKAGSGIFTADVANAYTGATTVSGGFLRVTSAAGLGAAGGANSVASGASLVLSGGITINNEDVTIAGTGVTVANGTEFPAVQRGALQSSSGSNTFGGNITISPVLTRIGTQDGASLTLTGNITGGSAASGLIFREGPGSVVTLSGTANTWLGNTMSFGGTLRNGVNSALPTGTTLVTGASGVTSTSFYDLNGFNQTLAGLTTDASAGGASNVTNNGAANSTLTLNGTVDRGYSGLITNGATNTIVLVKTGSFTQSLSGASTFTGSITIDGGTLAVTSASANNGTSGPLGNVGAGGRIITVNSGGTLRLAINNVFGNQTNPAANLPAIVVNGGIVNATSYNTIGAITLKGGTLSQSSASGGNYAGYQFRGNITVEGSAASVISTGNGKGNHLGANTNFIVADATGDSATDLTVSTPLLNQSGDFSSGTGALTKTGAGTMLLSATNTYTGSTTVDAGTFIVSGSISGSTAIAVNTGGTLLLGGAGTDRFGNATPVSLGGGTIRTDGLAEGSATTVGLGALTLAADSILDFSGTDGLLHFAASSAASWGAGFTLSIYNWSGSSDRLFFGLDDSASSLTESQLARISFFSDAGNSLLGTGAFKGTGNGELAFTAVPEPSTLLSGLLILGLVGWQRTGRAHTRARR